MSDDPNTPSSDRAVELTGEELITLIAPSWMMSDNTARTFTSDAEVAIAQRPVWKLALMFIDRGAAPTRRTARILT